MAAKTKTAKPKAKTKSKAKAKPDANPGPETYQEVVVPEDVARQETTPRRAPHPDAGVRDIAGLLRLIADPVRIKTIIYLKKSPGAHVGNIVKACGQSQPATSHHLALLRHSGLVYSDRAGKQNHYNLTDKGQVAATLLMGMMEQEV